MTDDLAQLSEALRELTGSYRNEIAEDIQRRQAKESAEEKTRNMHDAGVKAGQAFVASLNSLTKSVLSTEAGMSKYNGAIGKAGDAAFALGSGFGVLGTVVGGLIKILSMGAEAVLKQNDAMIKGYDALSEFGQTASLTSRDVLQLGKNAGYTSHNLEIFTKNAVKVSQEFAGLTGSASAGVVAFSKLTAMTQEQRDQYNRLGQGQETVTKLQTDYVAQTVKAGIALAKTPAELQKNSLKYIDSLNELAAITGISVEKQQEALDIANANENFNAYKFSMDQKRLALDKEAEEATKAGLHEKAAELKAQSENIQQVIRSKDEAAKLAVATMSAANSAAYLQGISTDGATIYTEANAKLLRAGIDVAAQNEKMNKGSSALVDILSSQVESAKRFDANFGQAGYAMGEHSIELQKVFGMDNKARETAAKFAALTTDEEKKAFAEKIILTQKELADKKAGLGKVDDVKAAQNAQLAAELKARNALEGLVGVISGPVTNVFTNFMKVLDGMMRGIAKYSDLIFKTNLSGMFESQEDIAARVADTAKELDANNKKIAALKNAMLDPEKATALAEQAEKVAQDELKAKEKNAAALDQAVNKELDVSKKKILMDQQLAAYDEVAAAKAKAKEARNALFDARNNSNQEGQEANEIKLRELEDKKLELVKNQTSDEEKLLNKKLEMGSKLNEKEQAQVQRKQDIAEADIAFQKKLLDDKKTAEEDRVLLEKEKSGGKLTSDEQARVTTIKKSQSEDSAAASAAQNSGRMPRTPSTLADLVSKGESAGAGNYNAANYEGGKKAYKAGEKNLVGMTIGELTQAQSSREIFAAGRYQIIPATMKEAVKALGLKESDKFDEKTQDRIFKEFLVGSKRPQAQAFLEGKKSADIDAAILDLAKEFASIGVPKPMTVDDKFGKRELEKGDSYYKGIGGNPKGKAHVSPEQVAEMLLAERTSREGTKTASGTPNATSTDTPDTGPLKKAARGGIFSGPMSGYPVELHGDEIVAPIELLKGIVKQDLPSMSTSSTTSTGSSDSVDTAFEIFMSSMKEFSVAIADTTPSFSEFREDISKSYDSAMASFDDYVAPIDKSYDPSMASFDDMMSSPVDMLAELTKKELPSLETTGINSTSEGFQLPELSSIFEDFKKKFEQLSSAPVETVSSVQAPTTTSSDNSINDFKQMTTEMIMVLTDKLDTVISKLGDGNDAREKILTYSMA